MATPQIHAENSARKFGGKDHTTAIYAYKKIMQENEENNNLTEELNLIKQRIYSA